MKSRCGGKITKGKVLSEFTTSAVRLMYSPVAEVSFVKTPAPLWTFPLNPLELNTSSISVLSPTASSVFLTGAEVHPQPGLTLIILKVSVPIFLIQKVCATMLPCGIIPKSQLVSGIETFGCAKESSASIISNNKINPKRDNTFLFTTSSFPILDQLF
ncbi:MAG: hypothetical protein V1890_01015 [Candidatus Zixiibacteriota bacterium]